jgi:hypothetical protein
MSDLETLGNFAWRIGVPIKTVSRKLRHPKCPQNFETSEGPTGRVVLLRSTPELETFMRINPRSI